MAQATSSNSISTRRGFLSHAAGLAAGGTALATVTPSPAAALPADDSALLKLEEQIFAEYEGAAQYDEEIWRLNEIWVAESKRLYVEACAGRCTLTPQERWGLVSAMPESIEGSRLVDLQCVFTTKMDMLIKQMFAIKAQTSEGRRAKAAVLISCIMGSDWQKIDEQTDYPEEMARNLLLEFVGGEPGEQLRGQFV